MNPIQTPLPHWNNEPEFGDYVAPAIIGQLNEIEQDKEDFMYYRSDLRAASIAITNGWEKYHQLKGNRPFKAQWTVTGGSTRPNDRVIEKLRKLGYHVGAEAGQLLGQPHTVTYKCCLANQLK